MCECTSFLPPTFNVCVCFFPVLHDVKLSMPPALLTWVFVPLNTFYISSLKGMPARWSAISTWWDSSRWRLLLAQETWVTWISWSHIQVCTVCTGSCGSFVFRGQPVAIIRSIAEKIHSNVEKVLVLAQDIQQPGVELRRLDGIWSSGWDSIG